MILFVAIISGAVGTCVQWSSALEDGFVYIDLSAITKSAEVQCFVRDIASREFPLVIHLPPPLGNRRTIHTTKKNPCEFDLDPIRVTSD